jgi:site-specific DNA recombinase
MRTLGYFFVSSVSPSLDEQQAAYDRFCRAGSHHSYETFTDDVTADDDRAGFHSLLSYITDSGAAFLVVSPGPECFGNDLQSLVKRVLSIDDLGSEVRSVDNEQPDIIKAAAKRMKGGDKSSPRAQRIREALRAKAVRGEGLGKPPYGYRIGDDGRLAPSPEEEGAVRDIYRWYVSEGLGIRAITGRLNERGSSGRSGAPWNMVTIRDILRNRAYIGTYIRFGITVARNHPALVDLETFHLVQERMAQRKPKRGARRAEEPFLLAGLAHCGNCGEVMIGVTRHRSWKRRDGTQESAAYRYYQCQSRANRSTCSYNTRRSADLEQAVRSEAVKLVEDADASFSIFIRPEVLANKTQREAEHRFQEQVSQYARGIGGIGGVRLALEELGSPGGAPSPGEDALQVQRMDRRALLTALGPGWEAIESDERRQLVRTLVARIDLPEEGGPVVSLRSPEPED